MRKNLIFDIYLFDISNRSLSRNPFSVFLIKLIDRSLELINCGFVMYVDIDMKPLSYSSALSRKCTYLIMQSYVQSRDESKSTDQNQIKNIDLMSQS